MSRVARSHAPPGIAYDVSAWFDAGVLHARCFACDEPVDAAAAAADEDFCTRCAALTPAERRAVRARVRDGNERRRDAAEARLAAIVESSDDAIISKDLHGIVTSWNGGAERLYGYAAHEVVGRPITLIMPPERFDEEPGILARIRRGERIERYETVRRRKDGTVLDISLSVSPVRDATGTIVGAAKIARDITARKRAERLAHARAEPITTLLDRAPFGVVVVGADLRVQHVNPIAWPVFGENGALVGRDFGAVLHLLWEDACADEVVRRFRHTLATGESYAVAEDVHARRDRAAVEAYAWEIHRIATPEGGHAVVCYFRDVGPDLRARAAIAASEERYRTLVSVISDVEWTADPAGRFVGPQSAWAKLTGQTAEEAAGEGWLGAFHPDDRARIAAGWRAACRDGEYFAAQGRVWSAAHREHRTMVTRATPIRAADGTIREWVGICTHVTEQRRGEELLRETNRQKDEFLAMLAHELRNPLSAVRNAIAVASLDPARRERALEIARRQTDQLGRLTDDLLDVARITRGRIPPRIERIAVRDVLLHAGDHTAPLVESRGLRLELALDADDVRLDADPARLEQIFVNLLGNAVKYTEPGGWIRVEARVEGGEAAVTVSDSGIGIAPEMLSKVWDLFAQGSRALDRAEGGLGIGLTVAKRLVELNGGRIAAASPGPGQGSSFSVRLPIVAGASGTEPPRVGNGAARPPGGSEVLVVEDNPDAADALVMLLELLGQSARVVHDGVAALGAARARVPDLMLVDIGLPGIDGYEVARRVRRDPALRCCLVVALTGYGRDEDERQARAAGFDDHLVKPVDVDMLRAVLRRMRDASHAARAGV